MGINKPKIGGQGTYQNPPAVPLTRDSLINQWVSFTYNGSPMEGLVHEKQSILEECTFSIYVCNEDSWQYVQVNC